jgi:predicted secreted protein
MMRNWFSIIVLAAACQTSGAAAIDGPHLAVLGFSRDGSAFAFEQFGWSEGSSYPFSELTVINTETGMPVSGAPFQSLIARDGATQQSARLMSYTAAQALLSNLRIGQPGIVVARASGRSTDPAAAELGFDVLGMGRVTVRLDSAIVKSVGCDAVGVKVRALAIRLVDDKGAIVRDLHKEKNPPPERLCPTGYGLAEIRVLPRRGKLPVLAVIVGMDRPGPGRLDRRYLGFVADLAEPAAAGRKE